MAMEQLTQLIANKKIKVIRILGILSVFIGFYYFYILPVQHQIIILRKGIQKITYLKKENSFFHYKFNPNLIFVDLRKGDATEPLFVGRYYTVKYFKEDLNGKIIPLTSEEEKAIQYTTHLDDNGLYEVKIIRE